MANEKRLTEKDKVAYHAIEKFVKANGYPPSVRELCRMTGKASTATICYRLKSLEQKGYIKTNSRGKRTIRITKEIEEAPTVDVVEVAHGRWVRKAHDGAFGVFHLWHCSVCDTIRARQDPYCGECGAKMDGGADNG